jgi:hypothetical protein
VEFAYNRSVNGATKFSPFEVVYGFNPCVLIDLVHIPIDERTSMDLVHIPIDERTSMDGIRKAELMKKLHEQVRLHIEEKTTKYGSLNLEFLFGFILARADFQANVSPS